MPEDKFELEERSEEVPYEDDSTFLDEWLLEDDKPLNWYDQEENSEELH